MSAVLREIQQWSERLPAWQQDALVRIFEHGQLTEDDIADLYTLLKAGRGLPDSNQLRGRRFTQDMVGTVQSGAGTVRMVAISNLRHVNALAEGKRLELAPEGLSVIYGGNGSGKSGYARLLKKACRARDAREAILPNADKVVSADARATATFTLRSADGDADVEWIDGAASSDLLGGFAVFDTRCARSYVDEQGETTYAPYGMDLLRGVADACSRLSVRLQAEIDSVVLTAGPFEHLKNRATEVGSLLRGLRVGSSISEIEKLATVSADEVDEHQRLDRALKEANPRQQAAAARQQAARMTEIALKAERAAQPLAPDTVRELERLIGESKVAKQAADLAAQKFEAAGHIPGTGGDVWVTLFQAARAFASEIYPRKSLVEMTADDACPLCQQPLGEAAKRLAAFDEFVEAAAAKAGQQSRERAEEAYRRVVRSSVSLELTDADRADVASAGADILTMLDDFQARLTTRQKAIKIAAGDGSWTAVPPLLDNPAALLHAQIEAALQRSKELDAVSDEAAAANSRARCEELHDRMRLGEVKNAVLAYLAAADLRAKLQSCDGDLKTKPITTKAGELTTKIVSDHLEKALNDEFRALSVDSLRVVMRQQNVKGQPLFSLALERAGQTKPNAILSEGEQRAIGIAAFLADLSVSGASCGIIFDDPVSSLDHVRRNRVAKRLAVEAKQRQVIVLTHDIYFLSLLRSEAKLVDADCTIQSLRRTKDGYGVASSALPFEGAKTKDRVKTLRQMHVDIVRFQKEGKDEIAQAMLRSAWVHLRQSWERGVEEVLFNGVVQRFDPGVSTLKLDEVVVGDDDVRAVYDGMTRCNTVPHDGAEIAQVPLPNADELTQEIERLESWRSTIANRNAAVKASRGLR